jgi:hypothetical protein
MSTANNSAAAPALWQVVDGNTTNLVVSLSMTMPPADVRRMLARHFSANAIRLRRRDDRDAALCAVAQDCVGSVTGGPTALAREIVRRLSRYCGGAHRFEKDRPPDNPERARLHAALTLNGGVAPSFSTAWRAISPKPDSVK